MLTKSKVEEVQQLLGQRQYSFRTISKLTGVSRGSVAGIAKQGHAAVDPNTEQMIDLGFGTEGKGRCPTCGRLIMLPCLPCLVESQRDKLVPIDDSQPVPGLLGVDLHGEYLQRYEEVKKWRQECSNPGFTMIPPDHPLMREQASRDTRRRRTRDRERLAARRAAGGLGTTFKGERKPQPN